MLSVTTMNVVMLSVATMNVVMLSVIALAELRIILEGQMWTC
jgi:hypothetical protein